MQKQDLLDLEKSVLKEWEGNNTRIRINESRKGKKRFVFMEGPPYASGELHLGHIRGYVRKDAILRYKRLQGFSVLDRSGFDVHGLPIENKVEKKLGIASKKEIETKIGVKNFIDKCIELYKENVADEISVARDYGVWLDFDNPYIPATAEYMNKSIGIFKAIYDKGLVYRGTQVMPYCIHCETVLAKGPEVEEETDTDPSVFIAFKINNELSKPRIELGKDSHLLIWTTTPWTIPANMAVAANPKERYVRVDIEGKEYILAKQRLDALSQLLKLSPTVTGEFFGSELEGILYVNPLEEFLPKQKAMRKEHRVVFSEELVTMSDGTGLVHIAPACGPEDFQLATKEKIPLLSIVDTNGKYNADAGEYAGISLIHDANRRIEVALEENGAMLGKTNITHSYPHCWRCHDKLVFMPTKQWFINMAKLKDKIKKQCEKVEWHPSELKQWFVESIDNAPDWVISRQRYWDIPIPIWECSSCSNIEVIGSYDELKARSNTNMPFNASTLHRPAIDGIVFKCSKCSADMHRVPDVFDVWYDSGVAHTAGFSEENFKDAFPNAYITEGPDQIRGWFATLMKTSVAVYNKPAFKTIQMQGWVVDSKGEAMHKSKGNYVSGHELLGKYSVDAIRLFTLSHVVHENLKLAHSEIEDMEADLILIHNIANLLTEYSAAAKYVPKKVKIPRDSIDMDAYNSWILSRLNSVIADVTLFLNNYEVNNAVNELLNFTVNDLSRFYLKMAKKKMADSSNKTAKATIDVLNYVLHDLLILLSPFMPLSIEHIYKTTYANAKDSIFLENWPKSRSQLINKDMEQEFEIANSAITAILNSREKAGMKLRWPALSAKLEVNDDSVINSLQKLTPIIEDYTNVKKLNIEKVSNMDEEIKPNFQNLGPSFKADASMVAAELKKANPHELRKSIEEHGSYSLHTDKGVFDITAEHFNTVHKIEASDAVVFRYGKASVDKTMNDELKGEGLVREFERRVQMIRKDMQLKKIDKVAINYLAGEELTAFVSKNKKEVMRDLNAVSMECTESNEMKTFDIEGDKVRIEVKKEKQ